MAAATMRRQSTYDSAYNTYARQHCVKLSGKQKPMLVNIKRKVEPTSILTRATHGLLSRGPVS